MHIGLDAGLRCARFLFVSVAIFLCATISPVSAERRFALVIGNDRYPALAQDQQLRNAVNDARAMALALKGLGFEVIAGENLTRAATIEKLSEFAGRLGQGDIAFFFFAGHGVALNGVNYMLPSDIDRPRTAGRDEEERIADLAVSELRVLDRIKNSGARVAVVTLDACRDNPLSSALGRSVGGSRGLAAAPETRGILSIYSAGVGQAALDRLGMSDPDPNSLFTRIFVKKLQTPGLGLRELAFQTQGEVAALAAGAGREQTPGVYSQIIGEDVYLAGRQSGAPHDQLQQQEFEQAMANGAAALRAFVDRYRTGPLVNIARREVERASSTTAPTTREPADQSQSTPQPARQAAVQQPALQDDIQRKLPTTIQREDIDRLRRFEAAREAAVNAAAGIRQTRENTPELSALRHALDGDPIPVDLSKIFGSWNCRSVQIDLRLGVFAYGYYKCQIFSKGDEVWLQKTTGSQRVTGRLFPYEHRRLVFVGASSVNDEPPTRYGENRSLDEVAFLFQISPRKLRLETAADASAEFKILEMIR